MYVAGFALEVLAIFIFSMKAPIHRVIPVYRKESFMVNRVGALYEPDSIKIKPKTRGVSTKSGGAGDMTNRSNANNTKGKIKLTLNESMNK